MTQAQTTLSLGKSEQEIKDEGYQAQAAGRSLVADNPYSGVDPRHWLWRSGFLEAFRDSN